MPVKRKAAAMTIAAACFFCVPGLSSATEPRKFSEAFEKCMASGDAARGFTVAMRACNDGEMGRLNSKLNSAYQALMHRLSDAEEKEALRRSERAWLSFMEAQCAMKLWDPGGTLGQVAADTCGMDMTAERIEFLRSYGKDL